MAYLAGVSAGLLSVIFSNESVAKISENSENTKQLKENKYFEEKKNSARRCSYHRLA
jgi:hypothetical protein